MHLGVLGIVSHPRGDNRAGVAVLLLISMMGGRLISSSTRNWLASARPAARMPSPFGTVDRVALAAGVLLLGRLARWQGWRTWREPLLLVLHVGYAWRAGGFLLLGIAGLTGWLARADAVHGLAMGAVGTMTLAVMTRATLGHTG